MTKKFVNLSKNYKSCLNEIKEFLTKDVIIKLVNNNMNFKELNDLHNKIENICENKNLNSYDVNKLIHYYDKKNTVIEILKKIASFRNKYIVTSAYKNSLWDKNLSNIKNHIKNVKNKNYTNDQIEKAFIMLLKQYKYHWDGLWSMIDIDKKGKINSVSIFDTDDFNSLIEYLN